MEQDGRIMDEKKEDVKVKIESSETNTREIPEEASTKTLAILEACKWKDVEELRKLATSEGGLLNDELRRKACKNTIFTLSRQSILVND